MSDAIAEAPPISMIDGDTRFECFRCHSVIPRENAMTNQTGATDVGDSVYTTFVYCDHCNVLYEMKRVSRHGIWGMSGGIRPVTDKKTLDAFMKKLDFLRGDRSIKQCGPKQNTGDQ
jgi:hypothetical protein